MELLIWVGAMLSLAGLLGLVWCIIGIVKLRRARLSDPELRAGLRKLVPLNTGALFLSVIGLMMVVTGILMS